LNPYSKDKQEDISTMTTLEPTQQITKETYINALPLIMQQDIKIRLIKLFEGRIKNIDKEIEYVMTGRLKDLEELINISDIIKE
jgi:hypothetical protein